MAGNKQNWKIMSCSRNVFPKKNRQKRTKKLSNLVLWWLGVTLHTRLRARDRHISSTFIGGMKWRSQFKFASHYAWGTDRVCDCKMDVKSTWNPTWHQMDHVSWSLGLFQKPPLGGRLDTKPGDHSTPDAHNDWFILFYQVWGRMNRNPLK